MKVTLQTHGGLTAGMRRPPRRIDGTALPGPLLQELHRLVAAAKAQPRAAAAPGKGADVEAHTITVEDDAGQATVLKASDTTMSSAFGDLLDWLHRHAGDG